MISRDAPAAAFSSRSRGSSLPTHSSSNSSESLHRPPTTSAHSSTSATAVAMSTRRSSSARSPRDINVLVDKLLAKVHGAPSAITTRRTVVRLHDAVSVAPATDSFSVLEKIKRKIATDAPQFYASSQETVTRLNEVYSRFVKFKNLDKKTEALLLLYGLMDTAPPPPQSGSVNSLQDVEPMSVDNFGVRGSMTGSLDSSALERNGELGDHHRQSMSGAPFTFGGQDAASSASAMDEPKTDLDSLEDSFKFAVGIAPAHKTSRGKGSPRTGTSPRTHTGAHAGTIAPGPMRSPVGGGRSTFDVPEEVLLRDVLYALQAVESRYLYFDDAADRFQITRSVGVPTPMRELIHMLCDLGWLYRKISEYIKQHREELAFGLVGQSFCHVLNTVLTDYFRLIAVLASQIDEDAETRQPHERPLSSLTLRTLTVWIQDPLDKMRLMARLIDSVEGLRGGALASGIHSHVLHGDPDVSQSVQTVMKRIAAPIIRMIKRWVFEGELEDVHGEFFVVADSTVSDDQFWAKKYTLNRKMLPAFISIELARKILVIGKSINFIRQCCGNADWVMDAAQEGTVIGMDTEDEGANFAELKRLEKMIENVSNSTNEYLIRTLMEKYRLLDHCQALKRYLLLGQGDFIQYLMDLLGPELSKRGSQVYRHTLTNVLETALNASNAKFESADILGRLDVELLQGSSADTGWDIFSLHYNLQAPVNSVIPASSMLQYQQIFDFLWRLKRVEHSLSASWTKDMNLGHEVQGCVPGIRPVLHRSQLVRSEMIHFSTNLLNYMMFEVLEIAWHKLVKDLNAAKDLDELIESHAAYILSIKKNGFMMKESRELLKQLKLIFATIIRFCKAQENLYTTAMHAKQVEGMRQQLIGRRELDGSWGIPEEDEYSVQSEQNTFGANSKILRQIKEISEEYSNQFLELLEIVKQNSTRGSQSLSFLMSRFDFNEFYLKKVTPPMDADE
ncbi:Gamma-tubulin complex component 3 [Phytophthora fragariae]|uniref:Gamma-tubulin complex component 3 n=1 Tax=Phytophthora fragariae TaxID=53985 RepID=A0A6A3TDW5_9STRA|nr:Gamma-tubulin complex component 3 [Phytophthora fragariae]KAE9134003.1 Gamma-tubulin complex component 3 [Phytophthora fragariae]KAE9135136.1 Gamma-tubulin complex component 3 [Phytophthora fragariae]KAE9153745.1 Gamma-tubulin complex component 3 [Phytophthora fragariae]KAE9231699.1 Gamma-tubulin complex component 3 [Phytophthora fragariae]